MDTIAYKIRRAYRTTCRLLDHKLRDIGDVSGKNYILLLAIHGQHRSGEGQTTIGDSVGTDRSTTAATMDRFEADGLIKRVRKDGTDGDTP